MRLTVAKIGNHQTVSFAIKELCRLVKEMDETVTLDVRTYASYNAHLQNILWVGLGFIPLNEKDTIAIDVKNGVGFISGSNERSILIAVYRFMKELGCRYLYPGKGGEKIPQKKLDYSDLSVTLQETASYRFRGICIEGTLGYEHAYNMIDWLPKVGMSDYYFQFFTPAEFFRNYYRRFGGASMTDSEVDALVSSLSEEIAVRSLKQHAVGHGWTCAPFGIGASGWGKYKGEPPADIKNILAMIGGERKFNGDIPLNTNLCYSNPYVREKIVDAVVAYCKAHPNIAYVHVIFADGENNHCECENCKAKIPSDYLLMILNEIDRKLTEANIQTKFVTSAYNDLLWSPESEKLHNPDRFNLQLCPISRSYSVSYADMDFGKKIEIEPYVRNQNNMHYTLEKAVAMAEKWRNEQKITNSLLFDYHLMWDHHYDPGYYEVAKTLQKDMTVLDKIGADGMLSCQLQRIAFPTNLPMYCMAKTLWNKNETFASIADEYYTAAFGKYGEAVKEYCSSLSALFDPMVLRGEKPFEKDAMIAQYQHAKSVIDDFYDRYITKMAGRSKEWEYLSYHAALVKQYADIYMDRFNHDDDACREKIAQFNQQVNRIAVATDSVLDDVFLMGDVENNLFGWRRTI